MNRGVFMLALVMGAVACLGGEGDRKLILDTYSMWRCYVTHRTPLIGTGRDDVRIMKQTKPRGGRKGVTWNTSFPPKDWMSPDFDASSWDYRLGPFFGGYGFWCPTHVAFVALRGTFKITDLSRVHGMAIKVRYRGGVVLYLNGKEFARRNLPEGDIAPDALAEGYPPDVYEGKKGHAIRWGWKDPVRYRDKCERRVRTIEVEIPSHLLRKGVNVVAIEIHRSPINPVLLKLKDKWLGMWGHAGLVDVWVTADKDSDGVLPNFSRPHGLQVWNRNVVRPVLDVSWSDPNEPLRPIRIVGVRRGWFSGQVVVSCDSKITGLQCEVTSLKGKGGTIDKRYVSLLYPRPGGKAEGRGELPVLPSLHGVTAFDAMEKDLPPEIPVYANAWLYGKKIVRKPVFGAIQPVWVRVWIPEGTKAGTYTGELTIRANGEVVKVPINVEVIDWDLPERREFTMFMDLIESPESVALRYGVKMWSEKHWKLLESVFKELARVASKTIYIHCIARTNHGNSQSTIRWVKDKDGLKPDFSIAERYLDTALECGIKPWFVIFYVHDASTGGGYFGRNIKYNPPVITVVDPSTGKVENAEAPTYDSPEAVKFWKPVAEGIRKMLKKRNLLDTFCIGMAWDYKPGKAVVECWKRVAPEAGWVQQGHSIDKQFFGVRVAYNTTVWGVRWAVDPSLGRTYGWKWKECRGVPVAYFRRDIWRYSIAQQLLEARILGERSIMGKQIGLGRFSADFWPCLKDSKGKLHPIASRYPENTWFQCNLRMTPFLAPGKEGAVPTVRFEMLVEDVQECEARIFLEKALLGDIKTSLTEEDKKKLQAMLDERTREIMYGGWQYHWQELSRKLFNACAKVAKHVQ